MMSSVVERGLCQPQELEGWQLCREVCESNCDSEWADLTHWHCSELPVRKLRSDLRVRLPLAETPRRTSPPIQTDAHTLSFKKAKRSLRLSLPSAALPALAPPLLLRGQAARSLHSSDHSHSN
jgi:hypothetical protein